MASEPAATFDAVVTRAVERFLQSAVVVDDRAYLPRTIEPTLLRTPTPESETLAVIEAVEEDVAEGASESALDPANTPLNAKEIVEAFAARGVICAVLRPSGEEADVVPRVAPRAIRNSDLIIVDWHLHGDDGDATIALLEEVVREAREAVRLVAIYTGDPDLPRVTQRLIERLGAEAIDEVTARIGSVRIVVIGKADEEASVPGRASEAELPGRLVEEFATVADGLVRTAALSAVGALRGTTYQMLDGLDHDIDLGYLGQRALSFPTSEAEDDLLAMLIADVRAIVDNDDDTRACIDATAVALWLQHETDDGRPGRFPPGVLVDILGTDLSDGPSIGQLKLKHPELEPVNLRKDLTKQFTLTDESSKLADERFAMRMTLRLIYDKPERLLSIGTVVADEAGHYWLCIQPACDSLRIKGVRRYPFVPLAPDASRFDYVLEDNGAIKHLRLSRKPADVQHRTFKASAKARAVLAKGDPLSFVTTSRRKYRWVAELNEAHAQRAAHELGAEQSRVGLAESNWLQKMSK